jgi:hypothetical protein
LPRPDRRAGAGNRAVAAREPAGRVGPDTFRFWSTDDAFVDQAEALLASGSTQVPTFEDLRLGTDCDPQWSWHVGPDAMSWSDFTIEVCDALPSYVEADPEGWIASVGRWCPWSAVVAAVDDRR